MCSHSNAVTSKKNSKSENRCINTTQLIEISGISSAQSKFSDVTPYTKGVGFSAKHWYPPGLLFTPPPKNSSSEEFALILFSIFPEDADKSSGLIPVLIRISRVGCADGIETNSYPIIGRELVSEPMEVGEAGLWINPVNFQFILPNGKPANPLSALNKTFEEHISPSYPYRGIICRIQFRLNLFYKFLLPKLAYGLNVSMWVTSGKLLVDSTTIPPTEQTSESNEYINGTCFNPFDDTEQRVLISSKAKITQQGMEVTVHSVIMLYAITFAYWLKFYFAEGMTLKVFLDELLIVIGFLSVPIYLFIAYIFPRIVVGLIRACSTLYNLAFWRQVEIKKVAGFYYLGKHSNPQAPKFLGNDD